MSSGRKRFSFGLTLLLSVLGLLALVQVPARAQADDPFSKENQAKDEAPALAQVKKTPVDDLISFEISVKPRQARRGEAVKLTITGTPKPGYHTYPMTKLADDPAQGDGFASRLTYQDTPGLKPLWPVRETPPEFEKTPGVGWMLEHKGPFTWEQDLLILPDAQPGPRTLRFDIRLQVCDVNRCTNGDPQFEVAFEVADTPAVALTPELRARQDAKRPAILREPVPGIFGPGIAIPGLPDNKARVNVGAPSPKLAAEKGLPAPAPTSKAVPTPAPTAARGGTEESTQPEEGAPSPLHALLAFIGSGIFWGAISLLTPCVFPMIPITVSFFLKQSEREHHRPLALATVYSGTIVVVLTLGGLLLMKVLQPVSQNWITQVVVGLLFAVFALSLFGMFEIRLPTSLANFTSAREGKGGLAGTMFMALTFTLISFTCVAPFYGSFIFLAASAQSAVDWLKLVLGALAYSVTFASPFFVLALVPSLLRSLPKSGSWMNTVKVVMGFLELAAALKFLRAGELTLLRGKADYLTHDLVLGMYVALALLCGLYLLNLYRLPHDDAPEGHLSVSRLLFSLVFLSVGFYLLPSAFGGPTGQKQRPTGTLFAWLDSFILRSRFEEPAPAVAQAARGQEQPDREPVWLGNLDKGLHQAVQQKSLVFVDFTGFNCVNCNFNENNVFSQSAVKELLNRYTLVQLYTDAVPDVYQPTTSAEENLALLGKFKTQQLPFYVILKPRGDGEYDVVDHYDEGRISNVNAFVQFLKAPLAADNGAGMAQARR